MLKRTNWLKLGALALVVVALALGAACKGDDKSDNSASQKLAPVQELRVALPGEPDSIDPQRASMWHLSIVRQLFRPLLWFDDGLHVVAGVAKEVPSVENGGISADGLTYTFHIREDAKWSDGKPLTARDFEYSIKRLFDPEVASPFVGMYADIAGGMELAMAMDAPPEARAELASQIGVEAIDDYTLVIHLMQPRPSFVELAALWPFSPVRQDLIEKYGDKWTEADNIVGNGPFVLAEWSHGDRMTLERNANWYGDQPYLERIVVRVIEDGNAALAAYRNNEIDIVNPPFPNYRAILADSSYTDEVQRYPDLSTFALLLNLQGPLFENKDVRSAISKAIDREAFIDKVRAGVGKPAYTWIPPGVSGYQPELGRDYAFDPEEARAALAKAGYASGKDFPKITFSFDDSPNARLVGEFVQAQLKQNLGIDVELEPLESRAFQERVMTGEFEMVLMGWRADYPDAENWLPDLFGTGSPANVIGYSNPEFDELMVKAMSTLDPVERESLWKQAEAVIVQDQPLISLAYDERLRLVKPWVRDLVVTGLDGDIEGDLFWVKTKILAH